MIPKDLEEVWVDILEFIRDGILESLTLEDKVRLNFQTNEERQELLADIACFAGVSGGDIIFGLSAEGNNRNRTIGRTAAVFSSSVVF